MYTSSESNQTQTHLHQTIDAMMSAHVLNNHERFSNELQLFLHEAREAGIEQIQAAEIMLERMAIHSMSLPNGVSVDTFEKKLKLVKNLQQIMLQ
jgi:hypothetical protein